MNFRTMKHLIPLYVVLICIDLKFQFEWKQEWMNVSLNYETLNTVIFKEAGMI